MAILKNENQRELEIVEQLEKRMIRRERRERLHRFLIISLGVLAVGAFVAGHINGRQHARRV